MTFTARFINTTATVWRKTNQNDRFGGTVYGTPETFTCSYLHGGKLSLDDNGVQFIPELTLHTFDQTVNKGDLVIIGDKTGTATPEGVEAYEVRQIAIAQPFRGSQARRLMVK